MFKTCYRCGEEFSVEMFNKNKSKPDGLATECKVCKSNQDKEYRERNKNKVKARKREYYLENKEEIIKKVTSWIADNQDKRPVYFKRSKDKVKHDTFSHYCDGEIQCKSCNEQDIDLLTIDHIDGNGAEHRREIFGHNLKGGGYRFYCWLKKNDFPEGFQVLCFNCNFRKRNKELKPDNPTHLQEVRARYARNIKLECLDNYGGHKCPCGETDIEVLTLDHVNDDGAEHRRETGTRGQNFYFMLRKNNFPSDPSLQVLCMNCQIKKKQKKYDEEREGKSSNDRDGSTISV